MSEFTDNVCVMDIVPMTSNEVLFINDADFKPFEKLSEMGGAMTHCALLSGNI